MDPIKVYVRIARNLAGVQGQLQALQDGLEYRDSLWHPTMELEVELGAKVDVAFELLRRAILREHLTSDLADRPHVTA